MALLLVALALFIASVLADRVLDNETLAQWLFVSLWFPLFLSLLFFSLDKILGSPPFGLGSFDFLKWTASKFGGWSPLIATFYFCNAVAVGVMFLLSWFIDAIEPWYYGFGALFSLVGGIVLLIGFVVFFDALAVILSIIAAIISIIVGLKAFRSQNLR